MLRTKYIHELTDWPKFHWRHEELTDSLVDVRHRQGILLGRMSTLGFDLRQETELNAVTEGVVKTSEIEGEVLSPDEVRSSVASRLGVDVGGFIPTRRDVDGIVDLIMDATSKCHLPLSDERLFGWHLSLFDRGRRNVDRITVGDWRQPGRGAMQVVSGAIGRERVHFEAPSEDRLEHEMEKFIAWFNSNVKIDDVLKAALAHLWFVTIHPFDDGNGRIARAISDMALARSDGISQRFYSMSSQIRKERNDYYDILELTQKGSMDVTNWMVWFLGCLGRAIQNAEDTATSAVKRAQFWDSISDIPLNERQSKVLRHLISGFNGKLTTTRWAKLTNTSQDTALRDITGLVENGILERGPAGGRSTNYLMVDKDFRWRI